MQDSLFFFSLGNDIMISLSAELSLWAQGRGQGCDPSCLAEVASIQSLGQPGK